MGKETGIAWCDHSRNFWLGCSKVNSGCAHCYAEVDQKRWGRDIWGKVKPRLYCSGAAADLRQWNKQAEQRGEPALVFVNSESDFFEDHDGPVNDTKGRRLWVNRAGTIEVDIGEPDFASRCQPLILGKLRSDAFGVFDSCPWLRLLLLTKRPENVWRMFSIRANTEHLSSGASRRYRSNLWLGMSASGQETLEQGIGHLLACRDLCPVLFLSLEPLLGPVNLDGVAWAPVKMKPYRPPDSVHRGIDLVIIGGESGPHARPCYLKLVRDLVRQCRAAGVACFVKQLGSNAIVGQQDAYAPELIGKRLLTRDPKGGNPDEWPVDLRIREFPKGGI